ncbi:3'(2'),5'-bisphosphate nucleotidase CysQ [Rhizorhabdus dicambivorans]|uniref:3'(2'),5'-bisphosphate nucleotidase CysQ n=1 Tax=Rhizorhabdus dicambivorans TaxID=1850238 RepID=A0A2A4FXV7_9SPHN|nr:3'(2'),5'-bisphosphate nucleotidase CysQ [Rhizorhabdus dicambivorans]ATE67410.1 3'(2'),5'-bisphosphate nucleotidase CysQ [Rhizorhabdus dicambivorans]PCE43035.1 3'(2'),5'-bisphosphate nucleotidase CysQ [Rhizorhabdus dicambivorans]
MNDVELAIHIADRAGRMLLDLRGSGRFEGKALGVEGDRIANAFIMETLRRERPDDAILSEEEVNDTARCSVERVWIVDPLDGTREYGEGRADWAVHVALAIGGQPSIGAVALPGLGLTLDSAAPPALQPAAQTLRMLVSRTRPAAEAVAVAGTLGAELVPMGSAGAKAMAVVRGEADIYLHSGGQYEWDNCAPVAVARAAGLHCSRIDGSRLTYNHANPWLPDLLICPAGLAEEILRLVGDLNQAA